MCENCGKALTKRQVWEKRKYCSRECYGTARYGEWIEYEGVKTRRPKVIEAAKLCRSGKTQAETATILGVHPRMISDWFERYGADNMRGERVCVQCGKSLSATPGRQKYCSRSCANKAEWARKHPPGRQHLKFDPALREKGLGLYWGGLGQRAISQHLGIAEGTVDSWVHDFGALRERQRDSEVMTLRPLKQRLKEAESAEEWTEILTEAVSAESDASLIRLVCGTYNGQGEISHHATVVADQLRMNPCSGEMFAFCNKGRNIITIIQWKFGAFRLAKIPKRRGSYLWPEEKLGKSAVVLTGVFNHLLLYEKNRARSDEKG